MAFKLDRSYMPSGERVAEHVGKGCHVQTRSLGTKPDLPPAKELPGHRSLELWQ